MKLHASLGEMQGDCKWCLLSVMLREESAVPKTLMLFSPSTSYWTKNRKGEGKKKALIGITQKQTLYFYAFRDGTSVLWISINIFPGDKSVLPCLLLAEIEEELVFLSPYTYIPFAYTESQQESLQLYVSHTTHFQLTEED